LFDEGCSKLLDQRKGAKLQWLQDPSKINGDNLSNIRRETSRHFRNRQGIIDELTMNSKKKNMRDLCRGVKPACKITYWRLRMVICLQIPTKF
jgi:hypothetical protein